MTEDNHCAPPVVKERRVSWSSQCNLPTNVSQLTLNKKAEQQILNIVTTDLQEERINKLKEQHIHKMQIMNEELKYLREKIPYPPISQMTTRMSQVL